ncbi:MFS transporter [Flavisphingomonas formosensis]|uniref:MFS transporter n=1 Tax=Flavisphingomonas formosensis TaxID=861534 RepID=UPI0012F9D2C7|nr:MFS transporter [Sphingomonas formosensis]
MAERSIDLSAPAERFTATHAGLIAMLAFVVMFEGFDISLTGVVLPYAGKAYGADAAQLGSALSVIGLGAIAAWFLIRLADRIGRRPVLLIAAGGFSLGSLATMLASDLIAYTALQFVTRALLVSQIAMAYLIVSETLPPAWRGRANGFLGAFGSFGAALPLVLLAPALETPLGWRALFVIGGAPLLLLPLLIARLRETPLFRPDRARPSLIGELRLLVAPALRGRFLTMSALWFVTNFASIASTAFFSFYVLNERGWVAADLALIAPFGLAAAAGGYVASGYLMDLLGRRVAASLYFVMLGTLTVTAYSNVDYRVTAACWVGLQAMLGLWTIAYTLNSELFPTEVRAAANGWCHNLIGRWGMVAAPLLLGWLAARLGTTGAAARLLGFSAFAALPLIWLALPETRGAQLEAMKAEERG